LAEDGPDDAGRCASDMAGYAFLNFFASYTMYLTLSISGPVIL
jgi:hypothetical protein